MNIVKITPKDDYVLYIKAEDGSEGLFDVKPYLESEAFEPLKNIDEFKRIYNKVKPGYQIPPHKNGPRSNLRIPFPVQ